MQVSYSKYILKAFRNFFSPSEKMKQEMDSYCIYYSYKGWTELLFGDKRAAARAFGIGAKCCLLGNGRGGKIRDAMFAFILCGDDKNGRTYGAWMKNMLAKEKLFPKNKYYSRKKAHLQSEFLAAYYTEEPEKLQEILDREDKSEICHICTESLCKELEGVRILFLIRMGRMEEARERLRRNLELRPWDEYMLAIRHMALGDHV